MTSLADRIQNAPDDARVSILYPNGEDIYDIRELKVLLAPNEPLGRRMMLDSRPLDHALSMSERAGAIRIDIPHLSGPCRYPAPCNCCTANL